MTAILQRPAVEAGFRASASGLLTPEHAQLPAAVPVRPVAAPAPRLAAEVERPAAVPVVVVGAPVDPHAPKRVPAPAKAVAALVQSPVPAAPQVMPSPEPAPTSVRTVPAAEVETGEQVLGWWEQRRIERARQAAEADHTVPGWALIPLTLFMLGAAIGAFALSFVMIEPVVLAAGWGEATSWMGPIVIDLAAVAAAFMSVASQHPAFKRTGSFLLVTATVLSIVLNLAGHQVKLPAGTPDARPHLPEGWTWAVDLFSVMVPIILATLIHVFGAAVVTYARQESGRREAEAAAERAAQQAEAARQAEKAAAEAKAAGENSAPGPVSQARKATALAKRSMAERSEALLTQIEESRGQQQRKEEALAVARKARALRPSAIRKALEEAEIPVPSQSTLENYARTLRAEQAEREPSTRSAQRA